VPVPAHATDTHIHVYDSRFPTVPGAALRPADATVAQYRALQQRLGLSRVVVVQPSAYGTDNACLLDALRQFGADARGVAVVDEGVTDAELERLHRGGVRAIRFNVVMQGGTAVLARIAPLSGRIAPFGWHVQIHMTADQIAESRELFSRVRVPIVFDHRGRIPPEAGVDHPAFAVIREMLAEGCAFVKLSSAYQDSRTGPPDYADILPVARALAEAAPGRMLWGTDWPHPTEKPGAKPDDAVLLDLLADWVPDASVRENILVHAPSALFGFAD
jgi:predicted TIM-barrel fold metal-dependent hydrolase